MTRMMIFVIRVAVFVAAANIIGAGFSNVLAKDTSKEILLGHFGAWRAYSTHEGDQQVCYMVTTKLLASSQAKRGTPYLMITHRPIEASSDVFNYNAGALLDARRGAGLRVGANKFDLFTARDAAWARDAQTDHKIAHAIVALAAQKKPSAVAHGFMTQKKKIKTLTDTFDISGADIAYHAIGKACGLIHEHPKKPTKPSKNKRKKAQNPPKD